MLRPAAAAAAGPDVREDRRREQNALLYGCPASQRAIGAMMCHYLAGALAEERRVQGSSRLDLLHTAVADVDGTILNEAWFKGPFTIYNYARNFFRPAARSRWNGRFRLSIRGYTFNSPLPETRALMKLIDDIKPEFHIFAPQRRVRRAFWYVNKDLGRGVYDRMYDAAARVGVPLDLGERKCRLRSIWPRRIRDARASDIYDYYEKFAPGNPADLMMGGDCSVSYALPGRRFL